MRPGTGRKSKPAAESPRWGSGPCGSGRAIARVLAFSGGGRQHVCIQDRIQSGRSPCSEAREAAPVTTAYPVEAE